MTLPPDVTRMRDDAAQLKQERDISAKPRTDFKLFVQLFEDIISNNNTKKWVVIILLLLTVP